MICFADTESLIKGNKVNKGGEKRHLGAVSQTQDIYFRQGKPTLGAGAVQAAACLAGESDAGLYQCVSE